MLCNVCTQLFRQKNQEGNHHTNGSDIIKASKGGCFICRTVVSRLQGKRYDPNRIEKFNFTFVGRILQISAENDIPKIWWLKNCSFKLICVEDEKHLARLSSMSTKPSVQGEPWRITQDELWLGLPESTGHPEALELAKGWLQECLDSHVECHAGNNEEDWYPPRLIDVTLRPPRLIDCAIDTPKGPYSTLSYCWGQAKFLTLTRENLEPFKKSIPFELLPQNFMEAIQVTESLGIRYIWIDSLYFNTNFSQ